MKLIVLFLLAVFPNIFPTTADQKPVALEKTKQEAMPVIPMDIFNFS